MHVIFSWAAALCAWLLVCAKQASLGVAVTKCSCSSRGLAVRKECSSIQRTYSEKGVFMCLEAVGGLSDLEQHGAHGSAEASPDYHCQHFILWAAFIPHLRQQATHDHTSM